ncbi:MAG: MFS transporter [Bryobacterales bacterium]|nr:MFS transporter [Bryobacterales bacterium]
MKGPWTILLAAFVGVFASFASVFIFTYSIFLKPLSAEFGWSRTAMSGGFAIAALTVAFASPLIGRLVDRFGSRAVIVPSATAFGLAFGSLSLLTPNLAHFYGVLFVMGVVGNGTTQLAFSRAVVRAFDGRRGMALAVMMAGTGIGSMVMPALAQAGIDRYGWRITFQLFGVMILLLSVPLTLWLIPHEPASAVASRHTGARAALRSHLFWNFVAAFFLMSLAVNASLAHLAPLFTDRGYSPATAALAASTLGGATLGGRLLTGWLLDKWRASGVSSILFACGAAGLLGLAVDGSGALAFVSVALIGIGMGAEADVIPYLISRHFDIGSFSELYGVSFSAFALAGAIGPMAMGRAFDVAGSYNPVLLAFSGAALLAALLIGRAAARRGVVSPAPAL